MINNILYVIYLIIYNILNLINSFIRFIYFRMRGKGRKFTGAVKMEVNYGLGKSL